MPAKQSLKDKLAELDAKILALIEEQQRFQVAPKFEAWRRPARIKVAYGGRGAGAKSWSCAKLLLQEAEKRRIKVVCGREIQKSIEESSYALLKETLDRLAFPGWRITKTHLINTKNGSIFSFIGLKDMRAASQVKSLEGIDIFFAEEAQSISKESWDVVEPTVRKKGSEIWAIFNREDELDPVYERFVLHPRADSIVLELREGLLDNPWFPEVLQQQMVELYAIDPDEASHIFGGLPRKQGLNSVLARAHVIESMHRCIPDPKGADEVGCDVARFGDDTTQMYRRKGLKVTGHRELIKKDTVTVAQELWEFAGRNPNVRFKIDVGNMGAGVVDNLRRLVGPAFEKNVVEISFGGNAVDVDHYHDVAAEMYCTLPIQEISIPDDQALLQELSTRRYTFDTKGRKQLESKDEYKKRLGRSPDKADALVLTFYQPPRKSFDVFFI